MPVDNSRLKGFYKLDVDERRSKIADLAGLSEEHVAALASNGELDDSAADRMIENVIGTMSLPVGVATNFIIDQKHYVVPFCLEESSVVAAASNMAKRCHAHGGFTSNNDKPIMLAQIQLLEIADHSAAMEQIEAKKGELMALANSLPSTMIRLGGGCILVENFVQSSNRTASTSCGNVYSRRNEQHRRSVRWRIHYRRHTRGTSFCDGRSIQSCNAQQGRDERNLCCSGCLRAGLACS